MSEQNRLPINIVPRSFQGLAEFGAVGLACYSESLASRTRDEASREYQDTEERQSHSVGSVDSTMHG